MTFLQFCQDIIVRPCETDLCRYIVYSIITVLFLISTICIIGIVSGEYKKQEEKRKK